MCLKWLFVAVLLSSVYSATSLDLADEFCRDGGSTSYQMRFAAIREDLLAKLDLSLPPGSGLPFQQPEEEEDEKSESDEGLDPSLLLAYEAAVRAKQARSGEAAGLCDGGRGKFSLAKRISLFFPIGTSLVFPSLDKLEQEAKEDEENSKDEPNANNEAGKENKQKRDAYAESHGTRGLSPMEYTFTFDLAQLPTTSSRVFSAELRLHKKKLTETDAKLTMFENVNVYYVSRVKDALIQRILVSSKNVYNDIGEYESLDVTEAVNKWIADASVGDNLELQIVINCPFSTISGLFYPPTVEFMTDIEESETRSRHDRNAKLDSHVHLVVATVKEELVTDLDSSKHKRHTIDSQYCVDNPNRIHCCIHNLEVNFHRDLNLTMIRYPTTFNPNYCQGVCPYPIAPNGFLKRVQDFYSENDIGESPCCVINEMSSLLVLMEDPITGNVILEDVPDMQITSCACS